MLTYIRAHSNDLWLRDQKFASKCLNIAGKGVSGPELATRPDRLLKCFQATFVSNRLCRGNPARPSSGRGVSAKVRERRWIPRAFHYVNLSTRGDYILIPNRPRGVCEAYRRVLNNICIEVVWTEPSVIGVHWSTWLSDRPAPLWVKIFDQRVGVGSPISTLCFGLGNKGIKNPDTRPVTWRWRTEGLLLWWILYSVSFCLLFPAPLFLSFVLIPMTHDLNLGSLKYVFV